MRTPGTRPDAPNDIVAHEHRRELPALRVFGAWANLTDWSRSFSRRTHPSFAKGAPAPPRVQCLTRERRCDHRPACRTSGARSNYNASPRSQTSKEESPSFVNGRSARERARIRCPEPHPSRTLTRRPDPS